MSLGFVPTFSSCVSAFPVPAVAYIGVFASVFRARAGTFVRIDSTFCTFDLPFGFGSLFFVPWVWFSTSIALVWGFGFVFFFRFPLLLLLSLCFVPSIVLASDPRVSTTFTRRSRSIVWFFFSLLSHDGTVRRSQPRHFASHACVVGILPSLPPSFFRFHAPWAGAADRCPLGAPWRRWFGRGPTTYVQAHSHTSGGAVRVRPTGEKGPILALPCPPHAQAEREWAWRRRKGGREKEGELSAGFRKGGCAAIGWDRERR